MSVTGIIGVSSAEHARHASFYDELSYVDRPPDTVVSHAVGLYVNENRNQISTHALELGAEWVWYIDDDHCFHPDTLTRLLAHNVDIVSGLYCRRVAPFHPVIYMEEDADGDVVKYALQNQHVGMQQVVATGAGCLLVKANVLRTLGAPYWRISQRPDGTMVGEDIDFCVRARAAGFTVWCDMDTSIGHLTTVAVYPHRVNDAWALKILDSKGRLIVAGAATHSAT